MAAIDHEAVQELRTVRSNMDMAVGILLDRSRGMPDSAMETVITVIDKAVARLGEARKRLAGNSEVRS